MMNADNFQDANLIYDSEFNRLMGFIIHCHELMLKKYSLGTVENNENKIRNRLYRDFLNCNSIKSSYDIFPHKLECETAEISADYVEAGYTDIKVLTATSFEASDAYSIIECKRLDGGNTLNSEYVNNGIARFLNGKYPSYCNINGMVGFIVKGINIDENAKKINSLMTGKKAKTKCVAALTKNSDYSSAKMYTSKHKKSKLIDIKLYHLMLDCSSIIA